MREKSIERAIMKILREAGCFAEKVHGSPMQRQGLPDIHATIGGMSVWIETKTPKKKATAIQERVLREIREAGGYASVVSDPTVIKKMLAHFPHVCRVCLIPLEHASRDVLECPDGHGAYSAGRFFIYRTEKSA